MSQPETKEGGAPQPVYFSETDQCYFFQCPHCLAGVQVMKNDVACKIFRHGAYRRAGFPQIPPHLPRTQCEALAKSGLIVGCGKPFLFVFGPDNHNHVEICDYI
jgi:hypothetical protein